MRLRYLAFLSVLIACDAKPPGQEGQHCGTFPSAACEDDLICVDDICTACGGPGEICCNEGTGKGCDGNIACVGAGWESYGTCSGDCGSVGLACCGSDDPCPNGGECNLGTCTATPGDACQSGKNAFSFILVEADCQNTVVTFMTDTPEQAEACRSQLADAAPGREVCAAPTTSIVCKASVNGQDTLYFSHCSPEQLEECELANCGVDCTWSDGACEP